MENTLLAIPSEQPGGLAAPMSMHFGHCPVYTLVKIENGAVANASTLPNPPHQEGGCLAAVQNLVDHGVKALLAGGMGMRPLMGFTQAGIDVYAAGGFLSVGDAVQAFLLGKLSPFSPDSTCKGHH